MNLYLKCMPILKYIKIYIQSYEIIDQCKGHLETSKIWQKNLNCKYNCVRDDNALNTLFHFNKMQCFVFDTFFAFKKIILNSIHCSFPQTILPRYITEQF